MANLIDSLTGFIDYALECIRFFAELVGVPRARVRIVTGLTNRTKVVEIDGVPQIEMEKRLATELSKSG